MPISIRDSNHDFGGVSETLTFASGTIDIVGEDGRTLFTVRSTRRGNEIEVSGGSTALVDGVMYDTTISITPRASNVVVVRKERYG